MKKLRRLIISVLVLIMSLTLLSGNLMSVLAAETYLLEPVTIGSLPSEGNVGEEINLSNAGVGITLKVKDPIGKDVTVTDNKFTPEKAGYYTVSVYAGSGVFYESYKINVTVDDAVIKIPYNGAEIATYINTGTAITIPQASMVVYDEENPLEIDQDATDAANTNYVITYSVTAPEGTATTLTVADGYATFGSDKTVTSGSYIIRYKATNGTIVKTRDFTVNVQEDFEDEEKPVLSVLSVPNSAAQKVKLTLPKATATDNKDSNVKITVTVKDNEGNKVKVVNDDDEKNLVLGTEEAVLDNDKSMSFYPWTAGPYNLEYTATDDNNNFVKTTYVINVSDTKAPVIELDEDAIPSIWGIEVFNKLGKLSDNKLKVPKPEVWDNVTPADNIELYLSIKDSSGVTLHDTKDTSKNIPDFVKEENNNYLFDFTRLGVNGKTQTGTFTLTFTARDKDASGKLKNSSYKAVSVEIKDSYEDKDIPEIQTKNIPQYVMVGDKFVKPEIKPYDATSKVNLDVKYELITKVGEEVVDTVEFDFEDQNYYVPENAGSIKITVNATDSVGNAIEPKTYLIDVYSDKIITAAPSFKADSDWTDTDATKSLFIEGGEGFEQRDIYFDDKASKVVNISNIVIQSASLEYDFIGYEVIVRESGKRDIDGVPYEGAGQRLNTTVLSSIAKNETNWELTLEKISFEVKEAGKHSLTIRAYNMSGASSFATVTFNVKSKNNVTGTSSNGLSKVVPLSYNTTIPTELELGEAYALPLKNVSNDDLTFVKREITGPAYEIMGNVFTPKAIGEYSIKQIDENGNSITQTLTSVDTSKPVFKVLGEVPSYSEKYTAENNAFVVIPEVSIIDKGTLKEYSVKVTKDGQKVDTLINGEGKEGFKPEVDGTYKITYFISDSSNNEDFSLTVKVGDLIMPSIKDVNVITPSAFKFEQGHKLVAQELLATNVSDNVTAADKLTISRVLYGPNGNIINSSSDDKNKEYYQLTDAGTYTLTYTVTDEAGNVYTKEFTLTVTGEGKSPINYQVLSTILIITAVVLIIGVAVYFFRFRKIKEKK